MASLKTPPAFAVILPDRPLVHERRDDANGIMGWIDPARRRASLQRHRINLEALR